MVRLSATAALAVGSLGVDALTAGTPSRPAIPRSAPQMSMARRAHIGAAAAGFAAALSGTSVSAAEPRSSPWSLSTFLDAVDADQVEKVSFAADGKQVISIDKDGNRHESLLLPGESAELVKALTKKNVVFAVQAPAEPSAGGAVLGVLSSLAFPLLIIGGLIFLQRRNSGGGGGGGGPLGGGGPMGMGKSKSQIQ